MGHAADAPDTYPMFRTPMSGQNADSSMLSRLKPVSTGRMRFKVLLCRAAY